MIGTFVNAATIIIGCFIGSFFKKILSEDMNKRLLETMGLAALGIGLNSVVQNLPDSNFPVLFIASLAIGCVIGSLLKIDERVSRLTSRADNSDKGSNLGEGIITGSLIFCVGTLSILGPVMAALNDDHTFLFTNATLDLVTSMVLASAYGIGMIVCAGILVLWQGSIYGLTLLLGDVITHSMINEISIVGGFMIAMTGLNIMGVKKFKTLDYLPALLIPVIWCAITG
ncbi:MAG: DUF554 domain-containing protein [Firmicutes bacterium]|nr:DUF554 domain-containing protein [Bacillota bacterium]